MAKQHNSSIALQSSNNWVGECEKNIKCDPSKEFGKIVRGTLVDISHSILYLALLGVMI